ncbi:translocation/assembly module TamB domain-containing protein [Donghicola tyrosinivorans]|uniref:Translocation and assembly module TamB n=1 Tax=Donghicola tyrosinivorans TaxID=1652492 RepID=A0A2T0WY90_9RHOB|nr:translocation/assembly module TamB domain-containing protein [Donghicola tyrosinivorans]PRY91673.1 translocation and assembly module TamB [Donghicola tyrosinivorans]
MRRWIATALIALTPLAGAAQDDDGQGYLERLLQDTLSGAGREVRIEGFRGALSSRATIDRLTIADANGVWLDAEGLALDWSRAALLRGRVEVNELSAESLKMPRKPVSDAVDVPAPEATAFTLPDLPVSVNVADLSVARAELGADVIGQDAVLSLSGRAQLANGAGIVALEAGRQDKAGQFTVDLAYDPDANTAAINVQTQEPDDGIIAGLIGLPDRPSIDLSVAGTGPADNLTVDVAVKTDAALRLGGQVTLRGSALDVDLGGDLRALLDERYHPLVGDDAQVKASAAKADDGTLTLSDLDVQARAVDLQGHAVIAPSGLPTEIALKGSLQDPDDVPLELAPDVTIASARIDLGHDAAAGPDWTGQVVLEGVSQAAVELGQVTLNGSGQIVPENEDSPQQVSARFDFLTDALQMTDPAVQALLGPQVQGGVDLLAVDGQPLALRDLVITARAFTASGRADVDGLESGYATALDLAVDVSDLEAARAASGLDLGGSANLAVAGSVTPLSGAFDLRVTGQTRDLQTGQQLLDGLAGGTGDLSLVARRDETGITIETLDLNTEGLRMIAKGTVGSAETNIDFDALVKDLARLGPDGAGRATLTGSAALNGTVVNQIKVLANLSGFNGVRVPLGDQTLSLSEGRVDAEIGQGRWTVDTALAGVRHALGQLNQGDIRGRGTYAQSESGAVTALKGDLSAELQGAQPADADLARALGQNASLVTRVDYTEGQPLVLNPLSLTGDGYGLSGAVSADLEAQVADVDLSANVKDAGRFSGLAGRSLSGAADVSVKGTLGATQMDVVVTATGRGLDVSDPHANGLLQGSLDLDGHILRDGDVFTIDRLDVTGGNLSAKASGTVSADARDVTAEVRVSDLSRLVEQFPGAVSGTARIGGSGSTTTVDVNLNGPAGMTAKVGGSIDGATLDLTATGQLPLGLANPMIAPRQVSGVANLDLAIRGPAGLDAVSGSVRVADGLFSEPLVGISLKEINGAVAMSGGRATVDMSARGSEGGKLNVAGDANLSGNIPVDITVVLDALVFRDAGLYEATTSGEITLKGPATGGASIGGEINIAKAELRIPETGAGAGGAIPEIEHIAPSAAVQTTRSRAGLIVDDSGQGAKTIGFPIDLVIKAPQRVFIRGRGLDAELGGQMRLRGATDDIIPSGRFDLVRGRLTLLGQRFEFDEGYVVLEGALNPAIHLVVETQQGEITTFIIVSGAASAPEVTFSSSPELPEDEVLAQLLFGRDMSRLSAFQALQLANAVATLAGKGGKGVISRLREGFALDDLDVTTDDQGNAAVRAGKYISDNVYTDVTVGAAGKTELNLNIDVSPSITARGGVDNEGTSSVGVFFERDY